MSVVRSILEEVNDTRTVSAGQISTLIMPPQAVDPVSLRNGNHDRDETKFYKNIVKRGKEAGFTNEPGYVNPLRRRLFNANIDTQ